jgi:hypothetical protein
MKRTNFAPLLMVITIHLTVEPFYIVVRDCMLFNTLFVSDGWMIVEQFAAKNFEKEKKVVA